MVILKDSTTLTIAPGLLSTRKLKPSHYMSQTQKQKNKPPVAVNRIMPHKNRREGSTLVEIDNFDWDNYTQTSILINLQDVVVPTETPRDEKEPHLQALLAQMVQTGYNTYFGRIAIALRPNADGNSPLVSEPNSDETVMGHGKIFTLIDGRHRRAVLERLAQSHYEWKRKCESLEAWLWSRKDGSLMTPLDILRLGAHLNEWTGTALRPSTRDHIYTAVSTARTIQENRNGCPWSEITAGPLRAVFVRNKSLGQVKRRQLSRYAVIAARLAPSKAVFKSVLDIYDECSGKLGVIHLSSAAMRDLDDEEFVFTVKALGERVKKLQVGRFESNSGHFFEHTHRMFDTLLQICTYNSSTLTSLMQETVVTAQFKVKEVLQYAAEKAAECECPSTSQEGTQGETRSPCRCGTSHIDSLRQTLHTRGFIVVDSSDGPKQMSAERANSYKPVATPPPPRTKHSAQRGTERVRPSGPPSSPPLPKTLAKTPLPLSPPPPPPPPPPIASTYKKKSKNKSKKSIKDKISTVTGSDDDEEEVDGVSGQVDFGANNPVKTVTERIVDVVLDEEMVDGPIENGHQNSDCRSPQKPPAASSSPSAMMKNTRARGRPKNSVNPTATDAFDDTVPRKAPAGSINRENSQSVSDKDCMRAHTSFSMGLCGRHLRTHSFWEDWIDEERPEDGYHPGAPLLSMFLPPEHRSHLLLTDNDIAVCYENVYWHLAHKEVIRNRECVRPAEKEYLIDSFKQRGLSMKRTYQTSLPDETWYWLMAFAWSEQSTISICTYRAELLERGFCVMESVLADDSIPVDLFNAMSQLSSSPQHERKQRQSRMKTNSASHHWAFRDLFKFMETSFPDSASRCTREKSHLWNWILNDGFKFDASQGSQGIGRFISSRRMVMEEIEQEHTARVSRARALLDMRIGACLRVLNLPQTTSCTTEQKMAMPKTGGRFLVTVKGCTRQQLHADFDFDMTHGHDNNGTKPGSFADSGCPGYFSIATAEHSTPIWVCRGSHWLLPPCYNLPEPDRERKLRAISDLLEMEKVVIPPWSVFFARGDVVHAGGAYADYDGTADADFMRYHVYFVPSGYPLPDAVHLKDGFRPRFAEGRRT